MAKRQVYAEMLRYGLLLLRMMPWDPVNRADPLTENSPGASELRQETRRRVCITVADLLHNIPSYTLHDGFEDVDFYFLNVEVPSYVAYCGQQQIATDDTLLALAKELRALVPEGQRHRLKAGNVS